MSHRHAYPPGLRIASGTLAPDDIARFFKSVEDGNLESVTYCLDNWPWLRDCADNSTKSPPLVLAALHGRLPLVRLLCERGADIAATNAGAMNAICHAACLGYEDIIEYLMSQGADPAEKGRHGISAIDCARASDWPSLADRLQRLVDDRKSEAYALANSLHDGITRPVRPLKPPAFRRGP